MGAGEAFLAGRTALVTGAARRLGRAVALALAGAGADVVVHYRSSRADARKAVAAIESLGRRAWAVRADLGEVDEAEGLFARAADAAGGAPDVLVNNASIFPRSRVLSFTAGQLAANVQVNAMAPLMLARALAGRGRPGDIVNLLDARVVEHDRAHAAYHLSKRMLHSLTRMLALELAPSIRVNAVAPGLILPPPGLDESFLARNARTNPLHSHGSPADVAEAVLFLLRSRFVTGQVIFVDGGRHLKGPTHD